MFKSEQTEKGHRMEAQTKREQILDALQELMTEASVDSISAVSYTHLAAICGSAVTDHIP